jgi:hypothetical protein
MKKVLHYVFLVGLAAPLYATNDYSGYHSGCSTADVTNKEREERERRECEDTTTDQHILYGIQTVLGSLVTGGVMASCYTSMLRNDINPNLAAVITLLGIPTAAAVRRMLTSVPNDPRYNALGLAVGALTFFSQIARR